MNSSRIGGSLLVIILAGAAAGGASLRTIAAVGFLVLFGMSAPSAHGDYQRDENGLYGVECFRNDSLYSALNHDASIYRCTIASHHVTSPARRGIEYGSVTLKVSATLCGTPTKEIVVPYSRPRPNWRQFDHSDIWQDAAVFDPQTELCVVVVPRSYDRTAPLLPGVDSAVSHVFVAKAPAADAFAFAERIGAMENNKADKPKCLKELERALKDKDKQVWKYAIDALAGRFTRESPGQALSILRDYVLHAKGDDRETEAWYDINSIRGMARDGNYDVKTRMAGFRALAQVAIDADDADIRRNAFLELAMILDSQIIAAPSADQSQTRDLRYKVSDVLSADEARRLSTAADDVAKRERPPVSNASIVKHWLDPSLASDR